MHFARFVQFAVVAVALVLATQARATALIYGDYYDETQGFQGGACDGTNYCYVFFSQIPSDKLLLAKRVSCYVWSTTQPFSFALGIAAAVDWTTRLGRYNFLAPPPSRFVGGVYETQINEEVNLLIGQGRYPFVQIGAPALNSMSCTISGERVAPIH